LLRKALLYLLLIAYFGIGLAYLGLRYYVWPRLDDWRPLLLSELSAAAGRPVTIGRIESGFEGLLPRITIEDLHIDDDDGSPALSVPRATAVLSPDSLFMGELRLAVLQLDAPALRVERLDERRLRVAGLELALDGPGESPALKWLAGQRRILLHDAQIDWIDRQRGVRNRFEGIALAIGSVGRRHRALLSVDAAGPGWHRLQAAIEIYRAPHSSPAQWRRWTGEAFIGIDGFDATQAAQFVMLPLPVASASGDLMAWLKFGAGRAQDLRLKLAANGVEWRTADGPVHLAALRTDLAARPSGAGYTVTATELEVADASEFRLSALGEQRVAIDAQGRPQGGQASFAAFDAAAALAFARTLPMPPEVLERLDALKVSGTVSALSARWTNEARLGFDAAVDFADLSLRYRDATAVPGGGADPSGKPARLPGPEGSVDAAPARPRLPWFENLSGEARITRDSGELRVNSGRSTLGFPGIFAQAAVPLDSLKAEVHWTVDHSADVPVVAVELKELRFANADAAGVVHGTYRTEPDGPGIVDLNGRMERAEASRAARYLPLQIAAPVRAWVESAILGGSSDDLSFRLRGGLSDFPFRDPRKGDFSITAGVHDGVLRYAPGWPQIERFQGSLAFERAGMRVRMRTGKVFDVSLGATEAIVEDFAHSLLRIEGAGEGSAADLLRFVNESPLAIRVEDFSRDTTVRGDAKLRLRLELPLGEIERLKVAGSVQFLGNELRLDNTFPGLSEVKGSLDFTEQGLALRAISATFLGGPLQVDGETSEPGRFVLRGEGRVSAQGMRTVVDNSLTQALDGSTAYRVRVDVRHRASEVLIESDLVGLSSTLPAPLTKPAKASWPLKVTTTPERPPDPGARPRRDQLRLELRDALRLVLERERDPRTDRLAIRRGSLALNAEPVLQDAGLSVVLNTDEVDVDAWRPLLTPKTVGEAGSPPISEAAAPSALLPNYVSVVARTVRVADKLLHDVVFGASRVGGFWRANISAREVDGFLSWREPSQGQRLGTLSARLGRLEVPRSRAREFEALFDAPPSELPGLDISAQEFVLFDRKLGRLELKATNSSDSTRPRWSLDALRIVNPAADFKASGSWAPGATAGVRPTRLEFGLALVNGGDLLAVYGLPDVLRGTAGSIKGTLHWIGSPLSVDYPSLGGTMKLELGKGQFLKTSPGIGKLVGVLSLQSLPRRLTLDFRDVFSEGFAFDSIVGDVTINYGLARTANLTMRGVQAQVHISGEADIGKETQSLEVEVRPELNAELASIAYGAMVNPVIGLGAFLAQLALRGPIQEMFSYEYDVTGSWADPQVVEKRRQVVPVTQTMP